MSEIITAAETLEIPPASSPFFVVGIGASAGGLEALTKLLNHIPPGGDAAYIIVTHMDPTHKSLMPEILGRSTRLLVRQISNEMEIEPQSIYVIPPNRDLRIQGNYLYLDPIYEPRGFRTPINNFFGHLSKECRERGVGIILSGTGSDGSEGVKLIKRYGGFTIAQSPVEAKYSGMPSSAIATGFVDQIINVSSIGSALNNFFNKSASAPHPSHIAFLDSKHSVNVFHEIIDLMKSKTGHDFSNYKVTTLGRRLERRLTSRGLSDPKEYLQVLKNDKEEVLQLYNEFLINVTSFFRDKKSFSTLRKSVIQKIVQNSEPSQEIRIWVAGCSSGEEAYSIGILFLEEIARQKKNPISLLIFATDVDGDALGSARGGVYLASQAEEQIPRKWLDTYFEKEEDIYKVKKFLRESIVFSKHDLILNPSLSRMDLICCRNVFIYFSAELQQKILTSFHHALKPLGHLFLGAAETLGQMSQHFDAINAKAKIYRRNSNSSVGRPSLPISTSLLSDMLGHRDSFSGLSRPSALDMVLKFLTQSDISPTILINSQNQVLYTLGRTADFLRLSEGEPSNDFFKLLASEFQTELRATVYSVSKTRESRSCNLLNKDKNGKVCRVTVLVRPLIIEENDTTHSLISFLVGNTTESVESKDSAACEENSVVADNLHSELETAKSLLSNVLKEAEVSYQELTASNEELMSTNEELQSTAQELETSREELQSLNEELETVNTELLHKVNELAEKNNDLTNFLVVTDIAIVFLDRKLNIRNFTPGAATLFGFINADIGRPLDQFSIQFARVDLKKALLEVLAGFPLVEFETMSANGKECLLKIVPYRTTDQRIDGLVLSVLDVSGIRAAEKALLAKEGDLSALVNSLPDIVITVDDKARLKEYHSGRKPIGVEWRDFLDRSFSSWAIDRLQLTRESTQQIEKVITEWNDDNRVIDVEVNTKNNIEQNFYECRVSKVSAQRYLLIFRDITVTANSNRLKIEKEIAEKIANARSEFIADMSHEIRTPLNAILGFSEALLLGCDGELKDTTLEYIKTIHDSGNHLLSLVNEILDISKIDSGRFDLEEKTYPIEVLFSEVKIFATGFLSNRSIEINWPTFSRSYKVKIDLKRMKQVLINLISNSIKYCSDGDAIEVRVDFNDCEFVISIADSGIGIPAQYLENIFERFEQLTGKISNRKDGTGLGLALVKGITLLHRGRVWAESTGLRGKGVTMCVALPNERLIMD